MDTSTKVETRPIAVGLVDSITARQAILTQLVAASIIKVGVLHTRDGDYDTLVLLAEDIVDSCESYED
jgi:hypothetical protein